MTESLTLDILQKEAFTFGEVESNHFEPALYGVTDGKAVGTYFEQKFQSVLTDKYEYQPGNSARGIDFPDLGVDMKVTSIIHPQSSCPFRSARQKIYGLGYHLLIFVYEKTDDPNTATGRLDIKHIIFVEEQRTADFQTTRGIRDILEHEGNRDDLLAFFQDRNLPVDEILANALAEELLQSTPEQGFLTISNALQWRLQYRRAIAEAGAIDGILQIK